MVVMWHVNGDMNCRPHHVVGYGSERGCRWLVLLDHLVGSKCSLQRSRHSTALNIHRVRIGIEILLVKIEVEMQPWSSRFVLSNHDWILDNWFPSTCCGPLLVCWLVLLDHLVESKYSLQPSCHRTALNIHRVRIGIEILFVKIEVEVQPWSSRFVLSNHDRLLDNWCISN